VVTRAACSVLKIPRSATQACATTRPTTVEAHRRRTPTRGRLAGLPTFVDQAPATVAANLCSVRTMCGNFACLVRKRRRGHQRAHYEKPELPATAPNQCSSWDITKLKSPATWQYFYLYVTLDVYRRYVVGWMVPEREPAVLVKQLIAQTCVKHSSRQGELTLHAARGSSMKSKLVALLLADLRVLKSHSRPHASDDNPFSEAQCKTLKLQGRLPRSISRHRYRRRASRQFLRLVQPVAQALGDSDVNATQRSLRPC
jgi:transposase InsO family protein